MTASPSRPTRRLIVWVILSVLTLVGLALVLSLGDSGTAAFQAGTLDTRSNLSAQRKVQGCNQTWTITVKLDGNGASPSRCPRPPTATPTEPSAPGTTASECCPTR